METKKVVWLASKLEPRRNKWGEPNGLFFPVPNLEFGFFFTLEEALAHCQEGANPIALVEN